MLKDDHFVGFLPVEKLEQLRSKVEKYVDLGYKPIGSYIRGCRAECIGWLKGRQVYDK